MWGKHVSQNILPQRYLVFKNLTSKISRVNTHKLGNPFGSVEPTHYSFEGGAPSRSLENVMSCVTHYNNLCE